MPKTSNKQNIKKRNWTFVAYPESLPENWIEILRQSGLKCAISPLHDHDINPDGEAKKPHFHIILVYGSPTTYNNVLNFTQNVLNSTIPQPLEQVRGMYRYFTHMDNPEKAQYDHTKIITLNGFNISDFVELTASEITEIKKRVIKFIRENRITEYCNLINQLQENGLEEELEIALNNTILFYTYIKSFRYSLSKEDGL